jgi:hypothetical protein
LAVKSTEGSARERKSAPKSFGRAIRFFWWTLKISLSAMMIFTSK